MRGDPATNFEGGSQYGRENAARPFLALPMTLAPSPRTLTTGLRWAEGPLWVERLGGLLFSDTKANTIYHLAPPEAEGEWTRSVFLRPSGYTGPHPPGMEHGSNGLHLDADGQIVLCSHGERGVFALNEERWTKRPLALRYRGLRLNSPNDVTQHASGALYFTDPAYGLDEGVDDPRRAICERGVYLTDPMTGSVVLATAEVEDPNGIGFSPDGETAYVSSTKDGLWHTFSVADDGLFREGRVLARASDLPSGDGSPDGLKVAPDGDIVSSAPAGIVVFAPDGSVKQHVPVEQVVSNVAFGREGVLFATATDRILRFEIE